MNLVEQIKSAARKSFKDVLIIEEDFKTYKENKPYKILYFHFDKKFTSIVISEKESYIGASPMAEFEGESIFNINLETYFKLLGQK